VDSSSGVSHSDSWQRFCADGCRVLHLGGLPPCRHCSHRRESLIPTRSVPLVSRFSVDCSQWAVSSALRLVTNMPRDGSNLGEIDCLPSG